MGLVILIGIPGAGKSTYYRRRLARTHFRVNLDTLKRRPRELRNLFRVIIDGRWYVVGHIARVPYLPPGSRELAQAVTEAMHHHDMVVMGNHGQVTVAKDADHVVQNAMFFELACEIVLRSRNDLVPLPEKEVLALLQLRQAANAAV